MVTVHLLNNFAILPPFLDQQPAGHPVATCDGNKVDVAALQPTATLPPDNAFVGLVPRKSNMQIGIQNALANVITTGRSTQVPLSSKRRHGVERPPATASWCFPIANKVPVYMNYLGFLDCQENY